MNAINSIMMSELYEFWKYIATTDCRCVVITGEGSKSFSAGADLKERYNLDEATWKKNHLNLQKSMLAMNKCAIPIIAAVNGYAYGGGFELALSADFIYAATTASFALPEVKLGIMPGAMGTQHMPRAASLRRAKEIILTGEPITAEKAYDWQIVNSIFPLDQLMTAAIKTAASIASRAPLSVINSKSAVNHAVLNNLESGYSFEVDNYNKLIATADRLEGIAAFNEKRKPEFKGE